MRDGQVAMLGLLSGMVRAILGESESSATCSYSVYSYVPQSIKDVRQVYSVSASSLEARLQSEIESLRTGQEVAFHSLVKTKDREMHLPMVDFSCKSLSLIQKVYSGTGLYSEFGKMIVFFSGRSYHAYGIELLSRQRWLQFMGGLLLMNPPNTNDFVDSRWVGHRLRAGYSALRWTANSDWYIQIPAPVAVLDEGLTRLPRLPARQIEEIIRKVA